MYAVESKRLATAKFLLDIGADVGSKARDASTPLHGASYSGDREMVCLLLQRGASVEAETRKGFRPLHVAALFGHEEVVRLLLEKDDNIGAATQRFGTENGAEDDGEGSRESSLDEKGVGITDVTFRGAPCLEKRIHQRLVQNDTEVKTPRSWTAQQLAAKSESEAVQRILAVSSRATKV
jgi:ankyrin repeat protein